MKKILSLFLAVMMVITMLPVAAFADELELFPMGEAPMGEAEEEALAADPEQFIEIVEPAPQVSEELISVQSAVTEKTAGIPGYFNVNYTSADTGTVEKVGTCDSYGNTGDVYVISLPEDAEITDLGDAPYFFRAFGWNSSTQNIAMCANYLPSSSKYMYDENFAATNVLYNDFILGTVTWKEGYTLPTSGVKGFALCIDGAPGPEEYTVIFVQIACKSLPVNNMTGAGTEEDPYIIKEPADLKYMSDSVNSGLNTFENTYFKISDEIESITLPDEWEPIGKSKVIIRENDWVITEVYRFPFCGHIDGNNKLLVVPNGSLSLIGVPGNWASVKNLNIYGEKIPGCGLVESYMVKCTMTIDNVTIKSGSHILKSGLIGGYGNTSVNISNCTVEKGVVIGDDGTWGDLGDTDELYNYYGTINHKDMIGSFCGAWNGNIINCKSYATVYGRNFVGGIVGFKGQSMRELYIYDCAFYGDIIATGEGVGGIMGSGYVAQTAPNTPCATIQNCYATGNITGADKVGGIFGGELGAYAAWSNGIGYVRNNYFSGTVKATKEDAYIGGVVGYMGCLNINTEVSDNYFVSGCGATKAVGGVEFNTDDVKYNYTATEKKNHSFTKEQLTNGELVTMLNSGKRAGRTDWQQGSEFPVHGNEKHIINISFKSTQVSRIYSNIDINDYVRDNNIQMTVKYSDGTSEVINASDGVISNIETTSDYWNEKQRAVFSYGNYDFFFELTVRKGATGDMTIKIQILGDSRHGDDGSVHTYKGGTLTEWLSETEIVVPNNLTLCEFLDSVVSRRLEGANYKYDVCITGLQSDGLGYRFISHIDYYGVSPKVRLAAGYNGENSRWVWAVNGINASDTYIKDIFLEDGDSVVLYYTDDYTQEAPSADYNAVMKAKNLINAIGTVTEDSGAAITAARNAYDALNDNEKTYIDNYEVLTEAEAAYKKLINKAPARPGEPVHIVIGAAANAAAKGEENPNTGAPVI